MKYKVAIIISLVALLVLPAIASAQATFGRQAGTVKDEDGNPLVGVKVTAGSYSVMTDEKGQFRFSRLEPGAYMFAFEKEGFVPSQGRRMVREGLDNAHMIVTLQKAVLTPKQQAAQLFQEANQLMQGRKFKEALDIFEQAMELDPDEVAYKANSGMCLYFLGEYEDALQYLEPAVSAYGNNPMVVTLTADSYFYSRDFEKAATYYENLAKLQPLDAPAMLNLSICYHEQDKLDEALASIDKVLGMEADNEDAIQRKAAILVDMEDYEGAIASLEKLHEIQGDSIDAKVKDTLMTMLEEMALTKIRDGKPAEAVSYVDKFVAAADSDEKKIGMLKEAGDKLLEGGHTAEALPLFERIIAMAPGSEAAVEAQKVIDVAKEVGETS